MNNVKSSSKTEIEEQSHLCTDNVINVNFKLCVLFTIFNWLLLMCQLFLSFDSEESLIFLFEIILSCF